MKRQKLFETVIGFVHNIMELKTFWVKGTKYFYTILQVDRKEYQDLSVFSLDKRVKFVQVQNTKQAVKLTNISIVIFLVTFVVLQKFQMVRIITILFSYRLWRWKLCAVQAKHWHPSRRCNFPSKRPTFESPHSKKTMG